MLASYFKFCKNHMFRNRLFISLIFSTMVWCMAVAQQPEQAKPKQPKPTEEKSKTEEKKESFGDYVVKVGEGVWGRVKERFNLEETIANLEEKKNKILGEKDKKKEEEKPKTDTPKTNVPKPEKKADS